MPKEWEELGVCEICGRKVYLIHGELSHGTLCERTAKKHRTRYIRKDQLDHQPVVAPGTKRKE